MKKILLIAAVAGLTMVSCKKDYTCECKIDQTIYMNGTPTNSSNTISDKTGKMKKADAKSKCDEGDDESMAGSTTNGIKTNISCEIK